jgi:hypothetical protein
MNTITDLSEFKRRKGLECPTEAGNVIQQRRDDLYDKFHEVFDLEPDECEEQAVECIWDACVSGYLQAKTYQDCIRAQIKLEGYYREFGELLYKPRPWLALTGGDV